MRGLPGSPWPEKGETGSDAGLEDQFGELDMLIDRVHECPVCSVKFSIKEVKVGKASSDGMDLDLRTRYRNLDANKYKVVECPRCGYADMLKYFGKLNKREIAALKEKNIGRGREEMAEECARSYSDAYDSYKAALRCNLIRGSKSSRRAHTALYSAWLLRGWRESMEKAGMSADGLEMSEDEERKLIKYALKNLKNAEMTEDFPINDMSEPIFDYLMAALSYEQGELDDAGRYVLLALQNKTLKGVVRPMAEDLREMIKQDRKKA